MATRLIELSDGTLVEIEAKVDESREVSGGFADRVSSTLETAMGTVLKITGPLIRACQDLQRSGGVASAEIELGFNFEAEGNVYIAKAKSSASIVVKLVPMPVTD